jgi:hypothetical protein
VLWQIVFEHKKIVSTCKVFVIRVLNYEMGTVTLGSIDNALFLCMRNVFVLCRKYSFSEIFLGGGIVYSTPEHKQREYGYQCVP